MGESYGGHYVPNTVKAIQESNAQFPAGSKDRINIKGFAVGNGYIDWKLDFNANVPNGRYHALTSQARFEAAQKACDGDYARCFWPRPDVECPEKCNEAVSAAVEYAMDGSIDIYDIYDDVCLPGTERQETQATTLLRELRKARTTLLADKKDSMEPLGGRIISARLYPQSFLLVLTVSATYLNRKDVEGNSCKAWYYTKWQVE